MLVDKNKVADLLGITPAMVIGMARNREIPSYKLGHKNIRFDTEEVKKWLTTKRQEAVNNPFKRVR